MLGFCLSCLYYRAGRADGGGRAGGGDAQAESKRLPRGPGARLPLSPGEGGRRHQRCQGPIQEQQVQKDGERRVAAGVDYRGVESNENNDDRSLSSATPATPSSS